MKKRDAIPYAIPLISLAIAMAAFIMAIVVPETNVIVVLALIIALGAVVMTVFSYLISKKTREDLLASRERDYEKVELAVCRRTIRFPISGGFSGQNTAQHLGLWPNNRRQEVVFRAKLTSPTHC